MCNFFGGEKEGKEVFCVCVNNEAPKTLYKEQACQYFFTMA